jgi:nitric oxide reductase NorQ protein
MYEAVSLNSQILKDLIVDGRRTTVANPTRTVITVEVEPEAEAEPISSEPTVKEKPSMVLSLATIPPKEIAESYVPRKIHGKEDFKVFDVARRNRRNILIYGPTGPGKTMAVTAYAASRGLRMASVSCNAALDVSQLIGKLVPNEDGKLEWVDGPVTEVVRNGGLLYIDEGNFAPPKIITSLFSLTDRRRTLQLLDHHGETIEAHPDLTIVMTMNPGYIGTGRLNAAFRNRFALQIQWDYDPEVEDKLVSAKNLLTVARQLRAEADKGMYETPIATNMLLEFMELADENTGLGYQFAVENFIAHFEPEEQASVRLVLQTHEANIREDLGLDMSDSTTFNINI